MVLAKAEPEIHAHYEANLVPEAHRALGASLRDALENTEARLLDVLGHAQLLADLPVLRRSIDVRNPYVDPLNLLQAELLRRTRAGEGKDLEMRYVSVVNLYYRARGALLRCGLSSPQVGLPTARRRLANQSL